MGFSVKNQELLAFEIYQELDRLVKFLKAFLLKEHNEDGSHITDDPLSSIAPVDAPYVTVGNSSMLSQERALVGTANQITVTDGGANGNVVVGTPQNINVEADVTFNSLSLGGEVAAARSLYAFTKTITSIADNSATTVLTVTVPNGNHAAAIRIMFLSSNGSTDAFESSRVSEGHVVVARTTGVNAVATAAALDDAAIATVAAGATHTFAYSLGAVSGAVGATNTFTIQVTIDDSGNVGSNRVTCFVELLNAAATGVTIS